jgi:hypothetical protein
MKIQDTKQWHIITELDNAEELPYLQSCNKIYPHKYEILNTAFL